MSKTPRKHRGWHRLFTSLIAAELPILIMALFADPSRRGAAGVRAVTAGRAVAAATVLGLVVFVIWSAAAAWRRAAARAREAERHAASPGRRRHMAGVR